jgi:hypothetical protein
MKYGNSRRTASAVISLTICDAASLDSNKRPNGKTKVLVGVRDPDTNNTDPNVVSVPTQRIPLRLLNEICRGARMAHIQPDPELDYPERLLDVYVIQAEESDSRIASGHDPVIYAVESILATKLGLAEPLERGNINFTGSPTVLIVGSVLYERQATGVYGKLVNVGGRQYHEEYQKMCNITVYLSGGEYIPRKTASYSVLKWISIHEFAEVVRHRGSSLLQSIFGEPSVEYCVHGLCLMSAHISLSQAV